jgi:hypothetical protein
MFTITYFFPFINIQAVFMPWHRYLTWEMEKEVKAVSKELFGSVLCLPYMDLALFSQNWFDHHTSLLLVVS